MVKTLSLSASYIYSFERLDARAGEDLFVHLYVFLCVNFLPFSYVCGCVCVCVCVCLRTRVFAGSSHFRNVGDIDRIIRRALVDNDTQVRERDLPVFDKVEVRCGFPLFCSFPSAVFL